MDANTRDRSEELSRSFYEHLGVDGLRARTRPEWDEKIVAALAEMLPPNAVVLDLGCGYGRIALPLARSGYQVEGLDLSENLVAAAHQAADTDGVRVRFTVGSMRSLPYPSESFDAVICLWSAFHELLQEDEQTQAVSEVWRVLRPGGFGLIEGPLYAESSAEDIEALTRRGPGYRIAWDVVDGMVNPHFMHDERSFGRVCEAARVGQFRVFERQWAGRPRLFLRLDKPAR